MRNPIAAWRNFLARPNDDSIKIFGVAILVAFACSVVVSGASVTLKPIQEEHLQAERAARMAQMLDTLPGMRDVMEAAGVDTLETRIVNLADGTFADISDPDGYDPQAAANDPEQSTEIPVDLDIAGLRRRANLMPVYLLERDEKLLLIVLPISGTGYQSTIRATLALQPDIRTIAALTITEQAETPGLGARVEDPAWQALWAGKQITDDEGQIVISVVRGTSSGPFEVDAISGATVSSNGVANMLRYWLGDHGYGPFLDNLAREGGQDGL